MNANDYSLQQMLHLCIVQYSIRGLTEQTIELMDPLCISLC